MGRSEDDGLKKTNKPVRSRRRLSSSGGRLGSSATAVRMRLNYKHLLFVSSLVLALFIYCEFLVYYIVVWWNCSYPQLSQTNRQSNNGYKTGGKPVLHAMFIADTHLLGSRLGHWFDKLRREWQMRQSFSTAYRFFQPEVVFFLGDVFDEAKWCGPSEFDDYLRRFRTLFASDRRRTKTYVVAGNHDIGFHYAVTPYLDDRFGKAFNASASGGVDRVSLKNIQFVLVNSMALHGDDCFLCSKAIKRLNKVSADLECLKNREFCDTEEEGIDDEDVYSRPILLQHFPLFRESDAQCGNEADTAKGREKTAAFRPQWDCLSQDSTKLLIEKLQPRFVISGHTHHGCKVKHKAVVKVSRAPPAFVPAAPQAPVTSSSDSSEPFRLETSDVVFDEDYEQPREELVEDTIEEWSVASFSWRNRNNPNFLLAKITQDQVALSKCYLPEEDSVITLYLFGLVSILIYCFLTRRRFVRGGSCP